MKYNTVQGRATSYPQGCALGICVVYIQGMVLILKRVNGQCNTGRTHFKKGRVPWNKGRKTPDEVRIKISASLKEGGYKPPLTPSWENHWKWKGDNASYSSIHYWMRRHFGKPLKCELCGVEGLNVRQYHWANISGEYKRDRNDWKRLCVSCHLYRDKNNIKI